MVHAKKTRFISFRISEELLIEVEMAAVDAGVKGREWCRDIVLAKLGSEDVLTPNERLLFQNLLRVQYPMIHGFQLLADHNLTIEEWKKLRANVKDRASEIAFAVLERHAEKRHARKSELLSYGKM
jgi:hypothetical protein